MVRLAAPAFCEVNFARALRRWALDRAALQFLERRAWRVTIIRRWNLAWV